VVEQIVVADLIHASMVKQRVDMFVEFLADQEAMMQSLQKLVFLIREHAWVGGIDRWEMTTAEWIDFAVEHDGPMVVIDEVEQFAVLHLPFWMLFIELRL